MCDEAVDDCPAALKFVSDKFVTNKVLEKFDNALHANDDILFYNEDFDKVTLTANNRHILAVYLDKINLNNNNNSYEDDPDTIIHIRLLAWHRTLENTKHLKKSKKLMPVAWHPKKWWNFCMS